MEIVLYFAFVALLDFSEITALEFHIHNHETRIQRPNPEVPSIPLTEIFLQKVVNGHPVGWHMVRGELHHNKEVLLCNSPYGHASVELNNGVNLYACLKPDLPHDDVKSQAHDDGSRESYRCIITGSEYESMEADLVPNKTINLLNRVGTVHYKERNKIDVQGDLIVTGRQFWS